MKGLKKAFAAAIAVVMVLSLAACGGIGGSRSNTVEIQNDLGVTAQHLYISAATADTWGDDLLDGSTLRAGSTAELELSKADDDIYDIKLVDDDGSSWQFFGVKLADGASAVLQISGTTPYCSVTTGRNTVDYAGETDSLLFSTPVEANLTLTNASGHYFWSGRIAPTGADDWGRDVFGSHTSSSDTTIDLTYDAYSSGIYDVKLYASQESAYWVFSSVVLAPGDALTVEVDSNGFPSLSVNGTYYTGFVTSNEDGTPDTSDGTTTFAPGSSTEASTGTGSLTLVNSSGYYFWSGRIAPSSNVGSSDWGRDVFGSSTCSDGSTIELSYDTYSGGIYDVKLYASNEENYWVFPTVSLQPGNTLTVTVGSDGYPVLDVSGTTYGGYVTANDNGSSDGSSGGTSGGTSGGGSGGGSVNSSGNYEMTLSIYNVGETDIWYFRCSSSTNSYWGSDLLGNSILSADNYVEGITVEGSDSSSIFDMAFFLSDNSTGYAAYNVDMTGVSIVVVDVDSLEAATAASYDDAISGNWIGYYTLVEESNS